MLYWPYLHRSDIFFPRWWVSKSMRVINFNVNHVRSSGWSIQIIIQSHYEILRDNFTVCTVVVLTTFLFRLSYLEIEKNIEVTKYVLHCNHVKVQFIFFAYDVKTLCSIRYHISSYILRRPQKFDKISQLSWTVLSKR